MNKKLLKNKKALSLKEKDNLLREKMLKELKEKGAMKHSKPMSVVNFIKYIRSI